MVCYTSYILYIFPIKVKNFIEKSVFLVLVIIYSTSCTMTTTTNINFGVVNIEGNSYKTVKISTQT